jgi:hypothetical protein
VIHIIGFFVLMAAFVFTAAILGVERAWIALGALLLLVTAALTAVSRTRRPGTPEP